MSTEVLRSTKRFVNLSCSASDRRSSISRVFSCQCVGSASQPARLETKRPCTDMSDAAPTACRCRLPWSTIAPPGRRDNPRRHGPCATIVEIDGADEIGVLRRRDLAIVGQGSRLPKAGQHAHGRRPTREFRFPATNAQARAGRPPAAPSSVPRPAAASRSIAFRASRLREIEGARCATAAPSRDRNRGSRSSRPARRRAGRPGR